MKKIVLYYFSGTGNTWWVAAKLTDQLQVWGHEVCCRSIEGVRETELAEQVKPHTHLILGFPAYGSAAPLPMQQFIKALPRAVPGQRAAIFATQALASGDTGYYVGQGLVEKGYSLLQIRHFEMMNNFHVPRFRFYRPKNNHWLNQYLLNRAAVRVNQFALEIHEEKKRLRGSKGIGHWLGRLQRRHIHRLREKLNNDLEILPERCIHCGKCERICPVKNIVSEAGAYRFQDHCAICLRCYSQCPTGALLVGKGSRDLKKFPRYRGPGQGFQVALLIDPDKRKEK